MASYVSQSLLRRQNKHGTTLGASGALAYDFVVTQSGSSRILAEVYVGKVTSTTGIGLSLSSSSGFDMFTTHIVGAKAATDITGSTDKAISAVSTSAHTFTSNAHGYTDGTAIALHARAGGTLPGGTNNYTVYFVYKAATNTFQLVTRKGDPTTLVELSAGFATDVDAVALRVFGFSLNPEVANDVAELPLRQRGRVVLTSGADDLCQVLDVVVSQGM